VPDMIDPYQIDRMEPGVEYCLIWWDGNSNSATATFYSRDADTSRDRYGKCSLPAMRRQVQRDGFAFVGQRSHKEAHPTTTSGGQGSARLP
jgi:hypothetical protein